MATILVVDDRATDRKLIVALLERKGHRSLEAADGAEALALARSERPDLVISDILMPTMDGCEFARRLRAEPGLALTKVIFHTAYYHERQARSLAKTCGVSHVLLKPCEPGEILRAIDQALAGQPQAAPAPVEQGFDRKQRRMSDELSESASQLRAANQRLAALTDVNLQLASERDPRALLKSVCRDARELAGASFAVLCVRDKNEGRAIFSTTSGMSAEAADSRARPQIDAGMFGQVLAGRIARRYLNPTGDPVTVGLPAGYPAVHSVLAAPIASSSAAYGWICLLDKLGVDEFDQDDERILISLASQVGRIYETESLHAELQRQTDQMKVEIAERGRSVELLRESELRFRQLTESIREVFFLIEPSFTLLYVSPAYEDIWGRTCESLYANPLSWVDSIYSEDRERAKKSMAPQGALVQFDVEYRIVRPTGGMRWIRARGFPIRDRDGLIYRIAGIAEDITERVDLERVLRESASQRTHADLIAKLAHIVTRPDGSFQSWSDTLPQLIGLEPARVPPSIQAWLEIVHPDDRDRVRAATIEAGVKATRAEIEYRIERGDGECIHVRQVLDPIRDTADERRKNRWFNTLQDITDQKRAQDTLLESERRLSDMLANVQLASLMLDREAMILYCNDYLLRLAGWQRDEVLGRDWFELFIPPEHRVDLKKEIFETLVNGEPGARHHENEILTRSGERRMIRWNNSVLRSSSGEVIGVASIGEDITERKRAEEEVDRLNANLERLVAERTAQLQIANRELEAFSHSVSHDLRAPLHAIRGFVEALKESPTAQLGEKDRHYLERIGSGSASMDELIDDLLSLARISRADLVVREVDLSALVTEVLSDLRAADPSRRTAITVRPGMRAYGDANLLRVALTNLLGNAWKFSGGRDVTVIEVGQLEEEGSMTTFYVRDRGAGFDPAFSDKLFGTFQRLHSQSEFPGSGVGLATVLRVIERHGGTVRAEGAVNRGATFYFSLPGKAGPSNRDSR